MTKIQELVSQLEKSNKVLGSLIKKSSLPPELDEEELDKKMPNEEEQQVDPQMQEVIELLESIPKESIPSIIEALQSKLEEPDVSEMAKSYKAMQKKIENLEKSLSQITTGKVIPSKTKADNVEVFEKSTTPQYGETGPKMLKKSVLVNKLKKDPNTKTGVLMAASDLPDNDLIALRDFYNQCEQRGIQLPTE